MDQDQDAKILRTGQAMQGQRNQINTRRLAYGKNDESARPEARRLEFQKLPARSQRVVEMKCKSQKEAFNQKKEPHLFGTMSHHTYHRRALLFFNEINKFWTFAVLRTVCLGSCMLNFARSLQGSWLVQLITWSSSVRMYGM